MSSIPALSFIGQFPFSYLRRVHVPGLDAAMGVTAYQAAAMTKGATISAAKGKKAIEKIVRPLEEALIEIWKISREIGQYGTGVAREAARGAMHAVDEVSLNLGHLSHDVVLAITRSTRHSWIKPQDVLREVSYGVVRGTGETSADVGEAALQAVEAAKEVAGQSGLLKEMAVHQAAIGALEAAQTLGPEAEKLVREALSDKLLELSYNKPLCEEDANNQ